MRLAVLLIVIALTASVFGQEQKRVLTTETWRTRARLYEPLIASTAERYNVDPQLIVDHRLSGVAL